MSSVVNHLHPFMYPSSDTCFQQDNHHAIKLHEPKSSKSHFIYERNAEMIIWKAVLTRDHIIKELFRSICSIICKNSWVQKYLISNPLEIKYANLDWWNISASDQLKHEAEAT